MDVILEIDVVPSHLLEELRLILLLIEETLFDVFSPKAEGVSTFREFSWSLGLIKVEISLELL